MTFTAPSAFATHCAGVSHSGYNIINGDDTDNTLNGTAGDDIIDGKGGKDTINGKWR